MRKTAVLQFSLITQKEDIVLPGAIVRFEEVVGRDDIGAFGIQFLEKQIPMSYKMLISNTLRPDKRARE